MPVIKMIFFLWITKYKERLMISSLHWELNTGELVKEIYMAEKDEDPLSPTMTKVLDEYLATLHADESIRNETADRLDVLLRKGKVPKAEDINVALFPPEEGDKS